MPRSPTGELETRPKGCGGCVGAGDAEWAGGAAFALAVGVLAFARRKRARR